MIEAIFTVLGIALGWELAMLHVTTLRLRTLIKELES